MLRAAVVGMGSWGQALVESVQGKSEHLKFTAGYTRTAAKAAAMTKRMDRIFMGCDF